ncbi:MAG: hypothetical protein NTY63_05380 [Candidatus Bipolaricaulota bacterium]|nr:hypothetical protein [Candidatus Bipolaricaulota bacterium]
MNRLVNRVGRFFLLFVLALAVLTPLWGLAVPYYGGLAAGVARPLFHAVERADVTVVDARDGEVWILRRLDEQRVTPFLYFDRYTLFAVIPLVALFVATPGLGLWRRAVRALLGVVALFVVQVGYLVAAVELSYAAAGLSTSGAFVSRTLEGWQILVRVLWEAGPLLIWIALSACAWKRFWRDLRAPVGVPGDLVREAAPAGTERGIGGLDTREGWLR